MLKLKIKQITILFVVLLVGFAGIFNFVASQTASAAKSEAEQWFTRVPVSSYSKDDLTDFAYFLAGEANGGKQGFRGCQDRDSKTGNPNLSSQYVPFFNNFINDLQSPDQSKVKNFTSKAVKTLQQSSGTYQSGNAGSIDQQCDNIAHFGIQNGITYAGVPTGNQATKEQILSNISQKCSGNIASLTGVLNPGNIEQILKTLNDNDYKKIAGYFAVDTGGDSCNKIAAAVAPTFATYTTNQLNTICKNDPEALSLIKGVNDEQRGDTWDNSNNDCATVKKHLEALNSNNTDKNAGLQCGADTTPLSWIICPIFNAVESAGNAMNSVVTSQLEVNTCSTFNSGDKCNSKDASTSDAYKGAWSAMRNIALIIIVIAGLIMIIAQAVGSQSVDAYTIKSVMPRLLIAAILISLSWIIMEFFVNLSNILGEGIRVLIYSPFSGLAHSQSPVFTGQNVITLLFGGIAIVGGIMILLAFAGTVFLALLIGFLVVVLRQLVLVFLIIIAPIAIALYALPNTQKIFSLWWDNFIKLLMMFPIMVGFIAVGRVFSAVSLQQGGFVNTIIATVAYILPFFLLPMTFKFAGGAMGGIAQGLHGFGQKVNAGIKKRRSERWAGRREKFKNGELLSEQTPFKSLNRLGGRVNKIGAGVGHGGFWGAYGLNKLGKANLERLQSAQRDERLKKPGVQDMMQDDDVRMALFSGGIEEAQALIKRFVDNGSMTKERGAQVMAAAKSIGFDSASRLAAWRMEAAQGKGRALTKMAKLDNVDDNAMMSSIVDSIAEDTGVDQDRLLQDTMFAFGQGARVDLRQQSLADVTKDRFDTRTVSALSPRGMERLSKYMTDDAGHTGIHDGDRSIRMRTAAQLLATQESLTMMAEPTRKEFTDRMKTAGVFDYDNPSAVREMELARQVDPQAAANYDAANTQLAAARQAQAAAQQRFDDEVRQNRGNASPEAQAALDAARTRVESASSAARTHHDTLSGIATEIRSTSSTYGQSMPYGARDAVLQDQQQQQQNQPPPGGQPA